MMVFSARVTILILAQSPTEAAITDRDLSPSFMSYSVMGYVVKMPKLGMEMSSGTITRWLVDEGESVEEGAVLAEIESEKTAAEIEARESGVLRRVFLAEGDATPPGGSLGILAGADEDITDLEAQAGVEGEAEAEADAGAAATDETETPAEASASGGGQQSAVTRRSDSEAEPKATPRARQRAEELGVDLTTVEGTGPQGAIAESDVEVAAESGDATADAEAEQEVKATPRAKRRAEELGVDLVTVDGTGPQGAVTEGDVETAADDAAASAAEPAEAASAEGEARSTDRVFAAPSARRLAREQGIDIQQVSGSGPSGRITEADVRAAATGNGEADTGTVIATPDESIERERPLSGMRRTIADRLGKSYRESVHVTEHRSADAEALLAAAEAGDEAVGPKVSVTDVLVLAISNALTAHPEFNATFTDDVHHLHEEQNIALAVDIDEGLVTPVIRGVESLSLAELAEKRARMTQKALSGEYTMDDLSGGTFTVSNLGVLGVESFDPIINPPQVAILGVNTIKREVVPVGDDEVGVRKRISFDLSFDHRIVDGADAARFLDTLVEGVENPWPLVIAAGGD
jgi:pyruvate dehydrogenase E2 component (dihydrolipoamide acetyltransferase)